MGGEASIEPLLAVLFIVAVGLGCTYLVALCVRSILGTIEAVQKKYGTHGLVTDSKPRPDYEV